MAMKEATSPRRVTAQRNWLDRAIGYVAPSWGLQRVQARLTLAAAERREQRLARIEAAEVSKSRGNTWLTSRLSPNSQLELDLQTARDRSRDLYQNDMLGGAVDSKVNHVIGTGHTPQARIMAVDGEITEEQADAYNEQLERVYRL